MDYYRDHGVPSIKSMHSMQSEQQYASDSDTETDREPFQQFVYNNTQILALEVPGMRNVISQRNSISPRTTISPKSPKPSRRKSSFPWSHKQSVSTETQAALAILSQQFLNKEAQMRSRIEELEEEVARLQKRLKLSLASDTSRLQIDRGCQTERRSSKMKKFRDAVMITSAASSKSKMSETSSVASGSRGESLSDAGSSAVSGSPRPKSKMKNILNKTLKKTTGLGKGVLGLADLLHLSHSFQAEVKLPSHVPQACCFIGPQLDCRPGSDVVLTIDQDNSLCIEAVGSVPEITKQMWIIGADNKIRSVATPDMVITVSVMPQNKNMILKGLNKITDKVTDTLNAGALFEALSSSLFVQLEVDSDDATRIWYCTPTGLLISAVNTSSCLQLQDQSLVLRATKDPPEPHQLWHTIPTKKEAWCGQCRVLHGITAVRCTHCGNVLDRNAYVAHRSYKTTGL